VWSRDGGTVAASHWV